MHLTDQEIHHILLWLHGKTCPVCVEARAKLDKELNVRLGQEPKSAKETT